MAWAGENHAFFRIVTFTSDLTHIVHKFWILILDVRNPVNLINNDRVKRINQSAIRNPKSKIAPLSFTD
jgi:hypothetical protein